MPNLNRWFDYPGVGAYGLCACGAWLNRASGQVQRAGSRRVCCGLHHRRDLRILGSRTRSGTERRMQGKTQIDLPEAYLRSPWLPIASSPRYCSEIDEWYLYQMSEHGETCELLVWKELRRRWTYRASRTLVRLAGKASSSLKSWINSDFQTPISTSCMRSDVNISKRLKPYGDRRSENAFYRPCSAMNFEAEFED